MMLQEWQTWSLGLGVDRVAVVRFAPRGRARVLRLTAEDEFFPDRQDRVVWGASLVLTLIGCGLYLATLFVDVDEGASSHAGAWFLGAGALVTALGGVCRRVFPPRLSERGLSRRLERTPLAPILDVARAPEFAREPVRVRGVVEHGPVFPSRLLREKAVLVRYLRGALSCAEFGQWPDSGAPTQSGQLQSGQLMEGVDFVLRLCDGTRIEIAVEHAYLLSAKPGRHFVAGSSPASGEIVVAPGDEVEILGFLSPGVASEGVPVGPRGPRVRPCLYGMTSMPLVVRRMQRAAARGLE